MAPVISSSTRTAHLLHLGGAVSDLQVVVEAMKHTAMEVLLLGNNEIGAEGAEAPLRRKSPGESGRDGMNFPPKSWEVPWSSVPERRILKVLKVQDSDGMYSIRSPSISELSESFQFVEMFEIIGFPIQPDAVQQKLFFWHGVLFFGFVLLLHDIARQQAS